MNNKQLAHVWAQQNRVSGKGSSFYFDGPTIYSYGPHFPIASFVTDAHGKEAVLFTYRTYSNSTAKHLNYTRGALHGLNYPVFSVKNPTDRPSIADAEYLKREAEENLLNASRARTRKDFYLNQARAFEREFFEFCKAFKIKHPAARKKTLLPAGRVEELKREAVEASKKEAAAREAREKREAAALKKERAEWRTGKHSRVTGGETMLRLKGEEVETSRGASVPLDKARELFRLWQGWRNDPQRLAGFLSGREIGNFTISDVQVDYVRIGCHTLNYTECAAILS
jgi:hypothetical protein